MGLKHRLNSFIDDQWAMAFGAKAHASVEEVPTDDPRDQYLRFEPFLVTVYSPLSLAQWQFINQIKYDWITENPFHSHSPDIRPLLTHGVSRLPIEKDKSDLEVKFRVQWIYYGKKSLGSTFKALIHYWNENE